MKDVYEEADRKERETLARIKSFANAIRDTGGECDCGEYGIFKITLTDGRVFRKAGMHGWGGIFRGIRTHVLASALRLIEEVREDLHHRNITIYLAYSYCGSEGLSVTPEQIHSVELET